MPLVAMRTRTSPAPTSGSSFSPTCRTSRADPNDSNHVARMCLLLVRLASVEPVGKSFGVAVDGYRLAGNLSRGIRGEEQYRIGNIVRGNECTHRGLTQIDFAYFFDRQPTVRRLPGNDRIDTRPFDTGGAHGIHTDAFRPEFHRPGFRQSHHRP